MGLGPQAFVGFTQLLAGNQPSRRKATCYACLGVWLDDSFFFSKRSTVPEIS